MPAAFIRLCGTWWSIFVHSVDRITLAAFVFVGVIVAIAVMIADSSDVGQGSPISVSF
jgi:hypothetical protein